MAPRWANSVRESVLRHHQQRAARRRYRAARAVAAALIRSIQHSRASFRAVSEYPFSFAGDSIYHALTAKVEKRFSNGLSFLAAYSKSKLIDVGDNLTQVRPGGITGTTVQDWSNLSAERSKSLYDVPQRLVVTTLYELPFGNTGQRFTAHVAGGWQMNGIMTTSVRAAHSAAVSGRIRGARTGPAWFLA